MTITPKETLIDSTNINTTEKRLAWVAEPFKNIETPDLFRNVPHFVAQTRMAAHKAEQRFNYLQENISAEEMKALTKGLMQERDTSVYPGAHNTQVVTASDIIKKRTFNAFIAKINPQPSHQNTGNEK